MLENWETMSEGVWHSDEDRFHFEIRFDGSDYEYECFLDGVSFGSGKEPTFDGAADQCESALEASDGQPIKYELCPQCEGSGRMVNRALSVWTESARDEDPEGFENMLHGHYDVKCDRCNGLRVVTKESDRRFKENREDHYTYLMESGIYPGSPDFF